MDSPLKNQGAADVRGQKVNLYFSRLQFHTPQTLSHAPAVSQRVPCTTTLNRGFVYLQLKVSSVDYSGT